MIKKLLAKLTNWSERREDFAKSRFRADGEEQAKLARERHEQVMSEREHKYVSEQTVPSGEQILGPSESALKEGEK